MDTEYRRHEGAPRYRAAMKKRMEGQKPSITGPMLKSVLEIEKGGRAKEGQVPSVSSEQLRPAAEYQDDGGGYNANYVFPQE